MVRTVQQARASHSRNTCREPWNVLPHNTERGKQLAPSKERKMAADKRNAEKYFRECHTSGSTQHETGKFEKKVLQSLNMIKLRVAEHSEQLDSICASLEHQTKAPEEHVMIQQFRDLESFLDYNDQLKVSREKQESLRMYMTRLGGNNLGDKVRRTLYQILSDEVSVCFNWTGTGAKRRFKGLEFTNVMLSVVTCPPTNATAAEVEKVVQTWLRHSHERIQKAAARNSQLQEPAA
ncbi:uncharacterized protein LOC135391382 [Ornithodoros turicata]|uniref:uncharacterized protein LOC135391382 n=1 Tax=Ornithodoros turicata TaxID=34597 RepID=UPI003138B15C